MGYKTKIDWCDSSWNPVTGCKHDCEYCYARGIANRFAGCDKLSTYMPNCQATWRRVNPDSKPKDAIFEVDAQCPPINIFFDAKKQKVIRRIAPYPWGFQPTLRRDRLSEPSNWKKPRTIFVCSMADLFGEWVPDEWIREVFEACEAAPQHRFLFLTKNPGRYCHLERAGIMPKGDNFWFGATFDHSNWPGHDGPHEIPGRPTTFALHGKMVHDAGDFYYPAYPEKNRFVSFEPLLYDIGAHIGSTGAQWHIIGAETGNRKGKVATQREWVEHIVEYSDKNHIPVFMKESLRGLMGDDFRQEFPWEVNGCEH